MGIIDEFILFMTFKVVRRYDPFLLCCFIWKDVIRLVFYNFVTGDVVGVNCDIPEEVKESVRKISPEVLLAEETTW